VDIGRVADLWEENQEFLKQRLGRSNLERFGARWVLMPEVPYARFNHVSCIRVEDAQVEELIEESRRYFREEGLPINALLITPATRPADLGARLYRMGFTSETNPVMVWDGTPIYRVNPAVKVVRATPDQEPLVFDLIREVFFPYASATTLAMGRRGVTVASALGAIHYIAYVKENPVGSGMLFCHKGMGGIYNMCTLPEYRGVGVATAILARCLADAKAMGCQYVGLTPTIMGRPLYERLGFREVYQERYFVERFYDWF
jgi:GNAT superfamily N-acetyltransferase